MDKHTARDILNQLDSDKQKDINNAPSKLFNERGAQIPDKKLGLEEKYREKTLSEEHELNQEVKDPHEQKKFVLLPRYNKSCNKCYGRGHIGISQTTSEYAECPKCGKNEYVWLDTETGNLRFGR